MADNIKIVGNITNRQQVSRYASEDTDLLTSFTLKNTFVDES